MAEFEIEAVIGVYRHVLEHELGYGRLGVAEENLPARIRGNLLMALANSRGGLVLSAGNKSEYSVGYSTLYGDMVGGVAVINDVPKTLAPRLAGWLNETRGGVIPQTVLDRPGSAKLAPDQRDTDTPRPTTLSTRSSGATSSATRPWPRSWRPGTTTRRWRPWSLWSTGSGTSAARRRRA